MKRTVEHLTFTR